jgi:hypothetical protein
MKRESFFVSLEEASGSCSTFPVTVTAEIYEFSKSVSFCSVFFQLYDKDFWTDKHHNKICQIFKCQCEGVGIVSKKFPNLIDMSNEAKVIGKFNKFESAP